MSNITLFGVDIAAEINSAMAEDLLEAVLHKVAAGVRTPGQLTGGTNPTETPYGARGFIEEGFVNEGRKNDEGALVTITKRRVILIGDSIEGAQEPAENDFITIEGMKHRVIAVQRDPARATYTCSVER